MFGFYLEPLIVFCEFVVFRFFATEDTEEHRGKILIYHEGYEVRDGRD
jgi:hypothetical protein